MTAGIESGARANPPYLGFDGWSMVTQAVLMFVFTPLALGLVIHLSRRKGSPHSSLIVFVALTIVALLLDAPATRLASTAYDPDLWHLPVAWTPSAPTVEPFLALVTYGIFVFPGLLWTLLIHPALRRRLGPDSIAARHPLWLTFLATFALGFVSISSMELFFTRAEVYCYTQVVEWTALRAGTTWQYPILLAAPPMATLMALSALLMSENHAGRSVLERIAHRIQPLRGLPNLASLVAATAILGSAYLVTFFVPFGAIYSTGAATTLARPWPYPDSIVFDPHGYHERAAGRDR
jgi:hypothetical protein